LTSIRKKTSSFSFNGRQTGPDTTGGGDTRGAKRRRGSRGFDPEKRLKSEVRLALKKVGKKEESETADNGVRQEGNQKRRYKTPNSKTGLPYRKNKKEKAGKEKKTGTHSGQCQRRREGGK